MPTFNLFFAAANVFVQWHLELVDQIGAAAFDEPRGIFAEMLAAFSDEMAEMLHHRKAHFVTFSVVTRLGHGAQAGV